MQLPRTNVVLTFLQRSAMTDRKLSIDITRCDGRITTNPSGFGTVKRENEMMRGKSGPSDVTIASLKEAA